MIPFQPISTSDMYCLRLLLLSLFLFLTSATADDLDESVLNDVHRILQKRSILDNVALDDPRAQCRNGGIYAGGICHCIKGQTGDHCEHFECGKLQKLVAHSLNF